MPKAGVLLIAVLLVVVPLVAVVAPPQGTGIFHSSARLVEVEVVVRGKPAPPHGFRESLKSALDSGPPFGPPGEVIKGLTKDDFELFDEGKAQPISIFRAGPSPAPPTMPRRCRCRRARYRIGVTAAASPSAARRRCSGTSSITITI